MKMNQINNLSKPLMNWFFLINKIEMIKLINTHVNKIVDSYLKYGNVMFMILLAFNTHYIMSLCHTEIDFYMSNY